MTIASEISRLQTDKECMRQAIIDKGVSVDASVSFDDYAACISAIPTGPASGTIDYILVGGGGSGGGYIKCQYGYAAGGGGGGEVLVGSAEVFVGGLYNTLSITIGQGGVGVAGCPGCDGGNTTMGGLIAHGGRGGGIACTSAGQPGGTSGSGCVGGRDICQQTIGGGGGGAGGNGENGYGFYDNPRGGKGGAGICGYGGGGAGQSICGCDGGGNGAKSYNTNGGDATNYGGGGGGGPGGCYKDGCLRGGNGCQGVAIIRYKTDGSDGILPTSTGGTKYTCGEYTIHCFTANGTFTPVYN